MKKTDLLLKRLTQIGQSLANTGQALALIGLGSVGLERERLDQFSDLDFFVIVEQGYKNTFMKDLRWLTTIAPAAYYFLNTPDGYKFLFEDGVFCEFAVFEERELSGIPFSAGRIVWKKDSVEASIASPPTPNRTEDHPLEWHLGEALTNLYVGLCRNQRGEKLSAMRFIQHYAVDRVIALSPHIEEAKPVYQDSFSPERRYEQRYPTLSKILPQFMQGYNRNNESALAILDFLEAHFEINAAMKAIILDNIVE